jgi:hypothetical protein
VTEPARYFSLLLVAKSGSPADPYIGIRHILKLALRRYNLKCVEARELHSSEADKPAAKGTIRSG